MVKNFASTINELVEETEELTGLNVVEKGDLALKLQFLYLLERVFGEECLVKFDSSAGGQKHNSNSTNISEIATNTELLKYLEQTDISLSLFGVTKKFFVMPVYKKLISLKPESVNSDNVGAIVRYGIYAPITISVYSEDILEKTAKFAKVYKRLSGNEVKIVQEYLSNDLVEKIINGEDSDHKKKILEEIKFTFPLDEESWLKNYERLLSIVFAPEFKIQRASDWSDQTHYVVGSSILHKVERDFPAIIYRYETFVTDDKSKERILFYPKDIAVTIHNNKSILLQKVADFEAIYKEKTGGKTVKIIHSC